ncbi:MAG: hypothetical protein Q9160_001863 [Pyrenula sp. 1 TL-2023]
MALTDLILAILIFLRYVPEAIGMRAYERQSELFDDAPTVQGTGWSVPLSNGHGQSLPPVPQGQNLAYLALGRGHRTFSCEYKGIYNLTHPVAVDDTATLINVAPLLFYIQDENQLHTLPAEILKFDYSQLNTSYECVGSFNRTTDFTGVFELNGHDEFDVNITHIIESPAPLHDQPWYSGFSVDHSGNKDGQWTYYVVETAGGSRPNCSASHADIVVEYAAEFWLYHEQT